MQLAEAPGPGRPAGPAGRRRRAWLRVSMRSAGSLAAIGLLAFLFRRADLGRIRELLVAAPWLLATPVFYFGVLSCDALGWRRLLKSSGRPPSWARLLEIRTAAEGLGLSLPSGGVFAEGMAVYLLRKVCGFPTGLAVASLAARRFFIFFSFGLALAASAVTGHSLLTAISPQVIGRAGLGGGVPAGGGLVVRRRVRAARRAARRRSRRPVVQRPGRVANRRPAALAGAARGLVLGGGSPGRGGARRPPRRSGPDHPLPPGDLALR